MADSISSIHDFESSGLDKGIKLGRELTGDVDSFPSGPRKIKFRNVLVSFLIFLFLSISASIIIYTFVSESLSVTNFSNKLLEHMDKSYPRMGKELKESYRNELIRLYKNRIISNDYALECETLVEFDTFMTEFKKRYDHAERARRHLIFRQRYFEVKRQKGEKGYRLGINKFSDLTLEERRSLLLNYQPIKVSMDLNDKNERNQFVERHMSDPMYLVKLKRAKNLDNSIYDSSKITPEDLDWRRPDVVTKVKDQGLDCSSCWAFASVAAVESIFQLLQDVDLDLSEQHLINCETRCSGCSGGYADLALDYVKNKGLPKSSVVPYHSKEETCIEYDRGVYYIDLFLVNKGIDVFNQSLILSPVLVTIGVSDSFFDYKSGIYDGDCSVNLNHAVLLVGEGYDPKTKKRYWIIKNSWGRDWGEDGFMRLERTNEGNDKCGILTVGLTPLFHHYLTSEYAGRYVI
ncbi:cysteine protease precursor, tacP, putative [Theileria annulata]|uniref:Cysteine protease, tacP, putative n=1 Tax=Theileria annulata TaxID=5874 RepID=Q4UCF4_THEAN|nr:cysteine protease precursor, tacP, putative [Theileria annulata]CAI75497.1 cysteine protease precursor, tacP, putative [Theileria annulata]|eukprot:XP_954973.1 cysteine protease precursor, tacP, putative [Theileria annulata]